MAMEKDLDKSSERYPNRLKHFNEIFIGHTPSQNYKQNVPLHAANLWDVDTGAAFKGCLSALDVDSKNYWQSDPLYLLYPNEKGRNK